MCLPFRRVEVKYRKIFKVEAEGDTLNINADNESQANAILTKLVGPIPYHMLKWEQVEALPKGEELLNQ